MPILLCTATNAAIDNYVRHITTFHRNDFENLTNTLQVPVAILPFHGTSESAQASFSLNPDRSNE